MCTVCEISAWTFAPKQRQEKTETSLEVPFNMDVIMTSIVSQVFPIRTTAIKEVDSIARRVCSFIYLEGCEHYALLLLLSCSPRSDVADGRKLIIRKNLMEKFQNQQPKGRIA